MKRLIKQCESKLWDNYKSKGFHLEENGLDAHSFIYDAMDDIQFQVTVDNNGYDAPTRFEQPIVVNVNKFDNDGNEIEQEFKFNSSSDFLNSFDSFKKQMKEMKFSEA